MTSADVASLSLLLAWAGAAFLGPWLWAVHTCVRGTWGALTAGALATWVLVGGGGWALAHHYTGEGVNLAALFHIQAGLAGLKLAIAGPIVGLAVVLLLVCASLGRMFWRRRHAPRANGTRARVGRVLLLASTLVLLASPGWIQVGWWLGQAAGAQQARQALAEQAGTDISPRQARRSMVHLYLEGLDSGLFTQERMPRLTALAREGTRIRGVRQVEFTGWTLAGQVASMCGYPPLRQTSGMTHCVGQRLAAAGYQQSYLNGSALRFAGKGTFWNREGYQRVLGDVDLRDLAGRPKAPLSGWGVYDDTLLMAAHAELARLRATGQPFGLTALTLDTHDPYNLSPACADLPQNDLGAAATCTDRLVGEFVERLRKEDPTLIIVLQSDHLSFDMKRTLALVGPAAHRDNLVLAWGPGLLNGTVDRQGTMFDLAPTLLTLTGQPTRRLNLGHNLLDPGSRTLAETRGLDWMNQQMGRLLLHAGQTGRPTPQDVALREQRWKDGSERERQQQADPLLMEKLKENRQ